MTFSVNNKLVLEPYHKEGLRPETKNGLITPGQRDGIKGLKVLIGTTLSDGTSVPAGSIAFFREEVLHNAAWAFKRFKSEFFTGEFILAPSDQVDFISTPDEAA
jgi:hypothetical protein